MFPEQDVEFSTMGGIETIQWRSNHIVDDWTNLHSYESSDNDGMISAIDIIHQLEHLPGIKLEGNHTISIRGLKSNSSGGHSSSPLVTLDIMLMDTDSAFNEEKNESTPGFAMVSISVATAMAVFINHRRIETESESMVDEDYKLINH